MRSYVFTDFERGLVRRMLKGDRDIPVLKLMHRIRTFETLRADVKLYLEASKTVSAKK